MLCRGNGPLPDKSAILGSQNHLPAFTTPIYSTSDSRNTAWPHPLYVDWPAWLGLAEWTSSSPQVVSASASIARQREARAKVASPQKATLTNRSSKARADARPSSSPSAKPSTAPSKPPKPSGQPSSWARRVKSPQGQRGGQGQGTSSDTSPAWAGAGRGKVIPTTSTMHTLICCANCLCLTLPQFC